MATAISSIEVRIWDQRAGAVALDSGTGHYVFMYEPKFVRTGIELAPIAMPLVANVPYVFPSLPDATFKRLPALLADALPDDFGNALIDAWMAEKGVTKDQITPLDRLAYTGKRGMGALEFRPARSPQASPADAVEMAKLVESARLAVKGDLADDAHARAALAQMIQVGTSAGGARAKAVIALNPHTKEIRAGQFDVPEGFEHWLLKLDGVGEDKELGSSQDYGRIEYAYYRMAVDAGITMSACQLHHENGRSHFMTKRFDRGGNKKHHIQTLCAMAHLDFKQKATHTYAQYFMTIERLGIGPEALEEAFRRMAFNVMARNCDDHTKNLSFLLREGGAWEMAPAYDVTYAYRPDGEWTYQHQMSVNGKFDGITRSDLLEVADRFGVGTAKKVLERLREAIASWPDYATEAGVQEAEAVRIQANHKLL